MHKKQTRIFKDLCFWRVRLLHCGTWSFHIEVNHGV